MSQQSFIKVKANGVFNYLQVLLIYRLLQLIGSSTSLIYWLNFSAGVLDLIFTKMEKKSLISWLEWMPEGIALLVFADEQLY